MAKRKTTVEPQDAALRRRFVEEVDRNFSVIAPAGVGKTKAIVDRVIRIATGDRERAFAWLPNLVVVTYTKKAADEMHQRARNEILQRDVDLEILGRFNRAFFGTIHSFCVTLLRAHGHHLGLPPELDLVEDDEESWGAFLRQVSEVAPSLPEDVRARCFRHVPMSDLFRLARLARQDMPRPPRPATGPIVDLTPVLDFVPSRRNEDAVAAGKKVIRAWQAEYERGDGFLELPSVKKGGAEFLGVLRAAFAPLSDWLRQAAWAVAWELATAYRRYRVAQGLLTYDDQVALACDLLRHPEAGRRMRAQGYRIILDEAQDTDPLQFDLLLELSRPPEAEDPWLSSCAHPPRPGHFCMVGDPQQSIYSDRADLDHYRVVRDFLKESAATAELEFEVTFRCDRAVIGFVNSAGPLLLNGEAGQAPFYRLRERPGAGPGQVALWRPPEIPAGEEVHLTSVDELTLFEARHLAAWIREQGLAGLRASSWSDVAILCPRKSWLGPIEAALADLHLGCQVHSGVDIHGDLPAEAWFTALLAVLAAPGDGFEIVGVLREIFGVSDDALARFSGGNGSLFQIERATEGSGEVAGALNLLAGLRGEVAAMPLVDAVDRILDATLLRERLLAIGEDPAEIDDRLDAFSGLAAEAEARGASSGDFAQEFRDRFESAVEAKSVQRDAIQLISCHKAKGLQWDAVILPLFFRGIGMPRSGYPLLIRGAPGRAPEIAFERAHLGDAESAIERRKTQELQRLLYVAMTRAKHTLVVADDAHLFERRKQSFADILGLLRDAPPPALLKAWSRLQTPLSAEERAGAPAAAAAGAPPIPPVTAQDSAAACEVARDIVRRVLPYALAERPASEEPEARLDREPEWTGAGAEAARQYGIWWHEFMQALDWQKPAGAWEEIFRDRLDFCPNRERARREWDLLKASDLARILADPAAVVQQEMPILWKRGARDCVEGLIDAAVLQDGGRRWLVIDWKTNEIAADGMEALAAHYAPQLNAYAESLRNLTGLPVTSAVYSTAVGRWVEPDPTDQKDRTT
jgi:ATP-dependent helicase/nuclease subunit A